MRRLADSATMRPFLYQVMVGGGTALDSHSRATGFPLRTFTTRGESPLLSLILGGTGIKRHLSANSSSQLFIWSERRLTENGEVDVLVRLPRSVHSHTAVLAAVRHFGL